MSSVVALSRPSVAAEAIRSYARGLLERATPSAAAAAAAAATAVVGSDDPRRKSIEAEVQRILGELVRARAGSVKNTVRPTRVTAADLVAAGVTLRDVEMTGVTARALAEFGIVRTLDAWQRLGIKSAAELFTLVGSPHDLRAWMAPGDWTDLTNALGSVNGTTRRAWWSAEVWLSMTAALELRDLRALGVNLDTWFARDAALFERARALAATWLTKHDADKWQKSGVLSAGTYAKLVALPTYFI